MKLRLFSALLLAGLLTAAAAFARQPVDELYDKAEYRIAMRDSVKLYTAVYTPKTDAKAPILIFRTPYGCAPYGPGEFPRGFGSGYMRSYIDRGYIVVMQDVRGRFMSEGEFVHVRPAGYGETDETTDSYDTVEWLVKHVPHNNGRVGFAGSSYPGFYAMMGGLCTHPAVKAVSPQAPVTDWFMGDDVRHNGVLMLTDSYRFLSGSDRKDAPDVEADPPRRVDVLPGTCDAGRTYGTSASQSFLGRACRTHLLRRMVAGARPAQGLLQRTAGRAGRRRDVRRRGLLRGVEPLPGHGSAKPRNAVPSGRGTLGARSMAQRQRKTRSVRFRARSGVGILYGAFRTPFLRPLPQGRGRRGPASRRRGFLVGRQPLACFRPLDAARSA